MHCHIDFHAEIGMAIMLKVGDYKQMLPAPKNFPTCHDYSALKDTPSKASELYVSTIILIAGISTITRVFR